MPGTGPPAGERLNSNSPCLAPAPGPGPRVIDNVGALVSHLEQTAVPEVERLPPPTPRWWKLPAKAVRTP